MFPWCHFWSDWCAPLIFLNFWFWRDVALVPYIMMLLWLQLQLYITRETHPHLSIVGTENVTKRGTFILRHVTNVSGRTTDCVSNSVEKRMLWKKRCFVRAAESFWVCWWRRRRAHFTSRCRGSGCKVRARICLAAKWKRNERKPYSCVVQPRVGGTALNVMEGMHLWLQIECCQALPPMAFNTSPSSPRYHPLSAITKNRSTAEAASTMIQQPPPQSSWAPAGPREVWSGPSCYTLMTLDCRALLSRWLDSEITRMKAEDLTWWCGDSIPIPNGQKTKKMGGSDIHILHKLVLLALYNLLFSLFSTTFCILCDFSVYICKSF